jgi:DNA-binding NtrC family response regulator
MTHVLVVHHDVDLADLEVDELRRAGYEVEQCSGPTFGPCPVLRGATCWMADRADVLVYDVWASGDDGHALIDHIRDLYPDTPVVLTSPGMELDWVETEGVHGVTPLVGAPTQPRLVAAIEASLAGQSRPPTGDASPG